MMAPRFALLLSTPRLRTHENTELLLLAAPAQENDEAFPCVCVCAFHVFLAKIDMYCELLNEQISAERYRTAGAGCGRGDSTPYIRDTALLSFRHSFALNVQVRMSSHLQSDDRHISRIGLHLLVGCRS